MMYYGKQTKHTAYRSIDMPLLANALHDLKSEIVAHFQEIYALLPKVARFIWLMIITLLTVALAPFYGIFGLSLYLWGEAEWSEKLTLSQKSIFWVISISASGAQWFIAASLMINFGFLS